MTKRSQSVVKIKLQSLLDERPCEQGLKRALLLLKKKKMIVVPEKQSKKFWDDVSLLGRAVSTYDLEKYRTVTLVMSKEYFENKLSRDSDFRKYAFRVARRSSKFKDAMSNSIKLKELIDKRTKSAYKKHLSNLEEQIENYQNSIAKLRSDIKNASFEKFVEKYEPLFDLNYPVRQFPEFNESIFNTLKSSK